jgi:hypothetical protein
MIVAVFSALFLTLVLGWFGRHSLAAVALVVCLALFVWEFLFEVYSPEYGFRMPWIQTDLQVVPVPARGGAA